MMEYMRKAIVTLVLALFGWGSAPLHAKVQAEILSGKELEALIKNINPQDLRMVSVDELNKLAPEIAQQLKALGVREGEIPAVASKRKSLPVAAAVGIVVCFVSMFGGAALGLHGMNKDSWKISGLGMLICFGCMAADAYLALKYMND